MTNSLEFKLPFFQELEDSRSVLIAGAGGGFDVFSGLPLYFLLRETGRDVFLANLSFSSLTQSVGRWLTPVLVEVTADSEGYMYYFPEQVLARWFRSEGQEVPIYCFHRAGVQPLLNGYRKLVEELGVDTVILVDGGTDSLMRGDEAGLGTPAEDMASIAAVSQLAVPQKLLACLGFGVDWYHGVCHAQVLEAVAELTQKGGYLGAISLMSSMPPVRRYMEASRWVRSAMREDVASIVCSSILSALEGRFAAYHSTERTSGNRLWISPLMTFYWGFHVSAVAERVLYLEDIVGTESYEEVLLAIETFRARHEGLRSWEEIPI
ncbi:MAG: DUF1152 domain-containing protein [Planctomycetota bacterium]|jgi:hypothetical protein